jgi:pyrroline-5-carboxylate reductase
MTEDALEGSIAFAGGGFMGGAIIAGLLARGLLAPSAIRVHEKLPDRRAALSEAHGVRVCADASLAVAGAALVVVAVKPQDFPALAAELRPVLSGEQTILSIMAGVTLAALKSGLGTEIVARAMPNTPGAIGEGFSGWTAAPAVRERSGAAIEAVLGALGRHAYFAEEKYLDMVTAVSGSGPGYVMLVVEAMIDAAVLVGLPRDVAREMVLQTVAGSARWAQQAGLHPAVLRDTVTSPGGTTAAGLRELEKAGVRAAFLSAVTAAWERSRALGG